MIDWTIVLSVLVGMWIFKIWNVLIGTDTGFGAVRNGGNPLTSMESWPPMPPKGGTGESRPPILREGEKL